MQWCAVILEGCGQLAALLRDPVYHAAEVPDGGNGQPILLIPGFLAGDWTLLVLAGWLQRMGYRPYLSGIDWNVGPPDRTGQLLKRRLAHIVKETGQPVIVIGHSLGGMLARFLGAEFPESVSHVVTVGSPVQNPLASHPAVRQLFFLSQSFWETLERSADKKNTAHDLWTFMQRVFAPLPSQVDFTAIFSKQDEIVDWQACLDPTGDSHEVSGRHVSLIVNREVFRALAHVLAT